MVSHMDMGVDDGGCRTANFVRFISMARLEGLMVTKVDHDGDSWLGIVLFCVLFGEEEIICLFFSDGGGYFISVTEDVGRCLMDWSKCVWLVW